MFGPNATVNVSLRNLGNLPTSLAFNLSAIGPDGWAPPSLEYRGSPIAEIDNLAPDRIGGKAEQLINERALLFELRLRYVVVRRSEVLISKGDVVRLGNIASLARIGEQILAKFQAGTR